MRNELKIFAIQTLHEAGDILRDLYQDSGNLELRFKNGNEPVTAADMASHNFIRNKIRNTHLPFCNCACFVSTNN